MVSAAKRARFAFWCRARGWEPDGRILDAARAQRAMEPPNWSNRHDLALELFLCPSDFCTWPVTEQLRLQVAALRQLVLHQAMLLSDNPEVQRIAARKLHKRRQQVLEIPWVMRRTNTSSPPESGGYTGGR